MSPSASDVADRTAPASAEEAAAFLREAGHGVRIVGGGTKLRWGRPVAAALELSTEAMTGVVEHNAGDLTAAVRAGTRLRDVQGVVGAAGQMLALDPPDPGGAATVGGIIAAGDTGPLRHRYGAGRDLVIGVKFVLADGTVASAGSRVIKNVAGYDLPKLFAASFGTLGLITEVIVRLHPLPVARATVVGRTEDPQVLQRAAIEVGSAPFELESFDVRAGLGGCSLLARVAGVAVADRARRVADAMGAAGLEAGVEPDGVVWKAQREGQRGELVVRVSSVRGQLARVVEAARLAGGELVGRASLGVSWIRLPADSGVDTVSRLRRALEPRPCVVLDGPDAVREVLDPWGPIETEALMRRVKSRFDPAGLLNPGLFREGW